MQCFFCGRDESEAGAFSIYEFVAIEKNVVTNASLETTTERLNGAVQAGVCKKCARKRRFFGMLKHGIIGALIGAFGGGLFFGCIGGNDFYYSAFLWPVIALCGLAMFLLCAFGSALDERGDLANAHARFSAAYPAPGMARNLEMVWDGVGNWRG